MYGPETFVSNLNGMVIVCYAHSNTLLIVYSRGMTKLKTRQLNDFYPKVDYLGVSRRSMRHFFLYSHYFEDSYFVLFFTCDTLSVIGIIFDSFKCVTLYLKYLFTQTFGKGQKSHIL